MAVHKEWDQASKQRQQDKERAAPKYATLGLSQAEKERHDRQKAAADFSHWKISIGRGAIEAQARCPHCGSHKMCVHPTGDVFSDAVRRVTPVGFSKLTFSFTCDLCFLSWEWSPSDAPTPPRPSENVLATALQRELMERQFQAPSGAASRNQTENLYIEAEELGMMTGASVVFNILGGPSAYKCRFIGRVSGPGISQEVSSIEFHKRSGFGIERLNGFDREVAQKALITLHGQLVAAGWQRVEDGPHWYSRRYRKA